MTRPAPSTGILIAQARARKRFGSAHPRHTGMVVGEDQLDAANPYRPGSVAWQCFAEGVATGTHWRNNRSKPDA